MGRREIPRDLRFAIYGRDRFRCRYCAIKLRWKTATLDHVFPFCRGGPSSFENMVTACWPCNRKKKDMTLGQIGWVLLEPGTRVIDVEEWGIKVPRIKPNPPRRRKRVAHRAGHRQKARAA